MRTIPGKGPRGPEAGADQVAQVVPPQETAVEAQSRPWVVDSAAPRHCGTAMEWKTPAVGTMYLHTFEGSGPAPLPPLWRCSCGFQLDGGFDQREAQSGFTWQSR